MSSSSISFVHLGARSEASLGESIARVEELCWEASRDDQGFLGLCDLNSLARFPTMSIAAARAGLRPVFGAEVGVLPFGETQYRGTGFRVRLLVENERGWKNLVRLVNRARAAQTPLRPPHIPLDDLLEDPRGLLVFLGGNHGEVTRLAADGAYEKIESIVGRLGETFGRDHLFMELPDLPIEGRDLRATMMQVAEHFDLMPVLIPHVNSAHPADDIAFRLYAGELPPAHEEAPNLGAMISPLSDRHHLMSRAQVAERHAGFETAMAVSLAVAQHCSQFVMPQVERRFPHGNFGRGVDAQSYIWNNAFSRATERYGDLPTRYKERLNFEFREIVEAGLANAVVGLIRLNEELETEGVQRGPGAGLLTNSVIASLLGLTRLDPLKFDLPFQLPAGLGKGSFPLLELSIPANQETAAAQALSHLFEGQVARVGEWRCWKQNQCLERLAQVLGKDGRWAGKMAKNPVYIQEKQAATDRPATWHPDRELPLDHPTVVAWLVVRMTGRLRELVPDPGVYTFSVDPIAGTAPLRRAGGAPMESHEIPVSEWTEEELGRLRHGRIAFVHSPLLDLIGESTELVRGQGNEAYAPEQSAPDDAATYRLLRDGCTLGIVPLENPVLRKRLRQGQPTDLHALIKILKTEGHDLGREQLPDFSTILLCHVCASIKAQNPGAFYAAALSQSNGDIRRVTALLDEARECGIAVSELLINFSAWRWTAEGNTLRPGFMIVRGVTQQAGMEILRRRQEMQYEDLAAVCRRTDKNKLRASHLRSLVKAGAFDRLPGTRKELLLQIEEHFPLLRAAANPDRTTDEGTFFGHDAGWWIRENELPADTERFSDTPAEIVDQELDACGFRLHDEFSPEALDFLSTARVEHSTKRFHLKMEGRELTFMARPGTMVPDRETPGWRLIDLGGILCHCPADLAERIESNVYTGRRLLLTGTLHREPFQWHLQVTRVSGLSEAMARSETSKAISFDVSTLSQAQLKALVALLKRYPGESRIAMAWLPEKAPRLVRAIASAGVLVCPLLETGLDRILGPGEWEILEIENPAERTSTERVRLIGRRVSSIAVRKLQGIFSR